MPWRCGQGRCRMAVSMPWDADRVTTNVNMSYTDSMDATFLKGPWPAVWCGVVWCGQQHQFTDDRDRAEGPGELPRLCCRSSSSPQVPCTARRQWRCRRLSLWVALLALQTSRYRTMPGVTMSPPLQGTRVLEFAGLAPGKAIYVATQQVGHSVTDT